MFIILIIVIALVAWSLHLMQEAFDHKEFSLMLAGTLVAAAAAARVAVYFLMGNYMTYVNQMAQHAYSPCQSVDPEFVTWILESDEEIAEATSWEMNLAPTQSLPLKSAINLDIQ